MPIDEKCQEEIARIVTSLIEHAEEINRDIQVVPPEQRPGWGSFTALRNEQRLSEIEANDIADLKKALARCKS